MPRESYLVKNVFTPTKPARATFVERESINDKLVSALNTPGKQIVVYGHSGSGKTTLLVNKLHQIYEDHLTTRCIAGLSFDQLVLDAFDQLGRFYGAEVLEKTSRSLSPSIQAEYSGIKAQLGGQLSKEKQTKRQRVLPPQFTPQTLARFLGEANCCWVLEDFHKIEAEEKIKLSQVMKVFMDMADVYADLKIIAIGAVDTARQVVEYDSEMRNRVAEVYVPLMTDAEIRRIIQQGEILLNLSIVPIVRRAIISYSSGLASVCHQLCFNMCFVAGINETLAQDATLGDEAFGMAVERYLEDASDTLKAAFDKAFRRLRKRKFDNGKLILAALLQHGQDGTTYSEILKSIRAREPEYPGGNLTANLRQLQTDERGAILRFDSASGRFSFSDPIYRAFAFTFFERQKKKDQPVDFTTNFDLLFAGVFAELTANAKAFLIASASKTRDENLF